MGLSYVKPELVSLKTHPDFNEHWVRDRIVEDPSILGLGDLDVKDVEHTQPSGGRLDLLLYDAETGKRYEVELMLGTVDESHIIRCLEYWDVELRRYPQYDHAAVLVAESITARFLNVISLFNRAIPMIAIQMSALKVGGNIVLNFTKVLDEIVPGEDDEVGPSEVADRAYWEQKGSRESVALADSCLEIVREIDPGFGLKYNKHYIGLADPSGARNFVVFHAKRQFLRADGKVGDQQSWRAKLEEEGLVVLQGVKEGGRVKLRLTKPEIEKHRSLLKEFFAVCYQEAQE